MSRLGFFAYGVGVACVTLLTAEMTINSVIFVYRYADGITALGSVGWLISSFGPIALSVFTWVIARKIQARWLPHLVFIPLAVLAFKEGGALYFHESGILADSMASDFALFAATGYL